VRIVKKEGEIVSHPSDGNKRQQIIKAAVKVFSQKGFHEAKVDEIAQLADVGKGTVYEYFSSKGELFQEMFKEGMQFYLRNLSNDLKPDMSCREKLLRIVKLHLKFVVQYKDLAKLTLTEQTYFNEDFHKWIWENRVKKLKLLEQIVDEGVARGEFRQVDSAAAAVALTGVLGTMFSPMIFSRAKINYKELIEPVMDIIFNGLLIRGA